MTIHNHRRAEFFPNNEIVNPQTRLTGASPSNIKGRDKVVYTVKSNDNLGLISAWHKVRVSDIKYWNKLHKNFIKAGQKLVIYVPEGQGEYYSKIGKLSYSEKQKSLSKNATNRSNGVEKKHATESVKTNNIGSTANEDFISYTVKKGDNFWSIAKKFPGISNFDIMKMNNIKNASSLKVGQVLKIYRKI
jgi:membrane-bound lytic murein transglycosylase D